MTARATDLRTRDPSLGLIGRLVVTNALVMLVLETLLTAPAVTRALLFDPTAPTARPWAILTFPFVHLGLAHLLIVSGLLLLFAPPVARRMGAGPFLAYYLVCAVGAALFGIALSGLIQVPDLSGALGPIYGVILARAWLADDQEVALDPLPVRVQMRTVLSMVALSLLVAAVLARTPGFSLAHAGGLIAGYAWFRIRAGGRRPNAATPLPVRRAVMTPVRLEVQESSSTSVPSVPGPRAPVVPPPSRQAPLEPEELDRLLDKISAHGLDSLTDEERQALTKLAERKRTEGR